MLSLLPGLALAGASIFVFPGLGDTIREPKWIWLWAFGFIGLGYFLLRPRNLPRLSPGIWVFLAYLLLQPFFFSAPILVWPFTLSFVSVVIISVLPFQESKAFDRILLVATCLQLILGGLQIIGWDFIFTRQSRPEFTHPLVGFLGQETVFGAWMAPLAWYWFGKNRWLVFAVCSLAVFATVSAFSIVAWVSGMAAWLGWRYSRRAFFFIAATFAAIAAGAIFQSQGFFYDNGRYLAWRMLLSAWLERPWFGYGIDSFAREFRYHQGFGGPPWIQAHSEYLELLFGGGVVGVVLGVCALFTLWFRRSQWWGRPDCLPWFLALTVVLANSLGNFPLHIAPISLLAVMAYFRLIIRAAV